MEWIVLLVFWPSGTPSSSMIRVATKAECERIGNYANDIVRAGPRGSLCFEVKRLKPSEE